MSFKPSLYNDCCLLTNIDLNSERIRHLLERRFTNNSQRTSFDFKSFPPEQPSTNAKVSRSFLRFQPKIQFTDDSDENLSFDSDSSEEQEEEEIEEVISTNDDDYYKELADWEPTNFQPAIETDDEEDDIENITQSVMTENNPEDSHMDHSSVQDATTSHVEDLLVTFIHRPVKSEPIYFEDGVFNNPPQLDGHIDLSPTQSSTEPNRNNKEKDLNIVIAKISKKTHTPKKTIQIYDIPPVTNKFRLNDTVGKKLTNQTPRKSFSSPSNIDRPKGPPTKDGKQTKKPKPKLLNSLLRNNEGAIRESDTRIPSIQTNNQKSFRTSSNNGLQSTMDKQQGQRKSISQQQIKSFSNMKEKRVPENQRCSSQSKGKSASDHMKLAQRKLNHFQEHHPLKSPMPNTSNSSSIKPKSKENVKFLSKPSKSIDTFVRRPNSISKTPSFNDQNQQIKKKIKKPKRLNTEQPNTPLRKKDNLSSKNKKRKEIEHNVMNKQQLTSQRSEPVVNTTSLIEKTDKRSAAYFDGCIVIDDDEEENEEQNNNDTEDDDIQEIERQHHSITYDIRAREKDLDHIVHSSVMHIKWLFNLEYLLLDHILICHEKNLRPLNKAYENSVIIECEYPINASIYHIDPTFISVVIINFIKAFLLRNSLYDQQEFSFVQFGITSHLRYLLIELPTYNHNEEKDFTDDCPICHQYSLIINILFDLLFDLMEYDLCELTTKAKYRSSLIEDDYFTRFFQSKRTKKNIFCRIKFVIYFIELIGIHMNKCQNKKQFQFNTSENKFFHSIEDFIRHIISHINNLITERLSLCFNVMELCLLFVNEKQARIKEMSLLLAELCQDDSIYLNLFLFNENLFVDIRLLLINELIWKKFNLKFISMDDINAFFEQIQGILNPQDPMDESALILVRSLLNSYADLIIEIKTIPSMYSNDIQQTAIVLRKQFELVFQKLQEVRFDNSDYFKQIKRTLMLYHLLKSKWNTL